VRRRGIDMYIVSHKTQYSNFDTARVDLREAALAWMDKNGFFDSTRLGFSRDQIFFADTRAEKIARIHALGCGIFIDDLEEVLADPAFPPSIKRVLFACDGAAPSDRTLVVRERWPDITRYVLEDAKATVADFPEASEVGSRLAGVRIRSVRPARDAGGNNRLFRIETEDGKVYALKSYPRQSSDLRDRLTTEFNALDFMQRHNIRQVPRPIAKDEAASFALYEWIEGRPAQASRAGIDAAVTFVRELHKLSAAADAQQISAASEACLSAQTIIEQVERRLAALRAQTAAHPVLEEFLEGKVGPVASSVIVRARKIYAKAGIGFDASVAMSLRSLSPSDFGFHNALVQNDGRIVFLDFEYFGWDDPVKLASDFVLHPGMDLTAELKRRFLESMSDIFRADKSFDMRLEASLPLYALRWTMILLNEFLPERWARRIMAGAGADRDAILQAQLNKARAMIGRTEHEGLMK